MVHGQFAFQVAAVTSKGLRRAQNQDTVTVDDVLLTGEMAEPFVCHLSADEPRLFMIADGMGGHAAGEAASRSASAFLQSHRRQLVEHEACERTLRSCNEALYRLMAQDERHLGMGTTVVGICAVDHRLTLFNVGDSRCYRVKKGRVSMLSIDDALLRHDDSQNHNSRVPGVITQALGGHPQLSHILPHVTLMELDDSERYMLCSDGLTDEVKDDTINRILISEKDARVCVTRLFETAITSGGRDNISILVLDPIRSHAACGTAGGLAE